MTKLGAVDFANEAIRNSGATPEALAELRAWLDRHETSDCSECRAVLRRMIAFVRLPTVQSPPKELRRIRWACSPVEMAAMQAGPFEYLALAAMIAAAEHPEDFG
ncbi:MAG: hypothetical protein A3G80_07590 [Betaproteobacteria bacterium RIFCSPLOWO2_12_FULL_62_13b]|nr:MAG: hypothetical protein A3G80_07590 [Betaproteobacteria bacterium RIFCSPLOWO2_12_FULL_62_13b]